MKTDNTNILIQKYSLVPIGEQEDKENAYRFIRDCMYAYYKMSNYIMGHYCSAFYGNGCALDMEAFKEQNKDLFSYNNPAYTEMFVEKKSKKKKKETKSENRQKIKRDILADSKVLDILSESEKRVENDFKESLASGLADGKITAKNYKRKESFTFDSDTLDIDVQYRNNKDGNPVVSSVNANISWVNGIKFNVFFEKSTYGANQRRTFLRIRSGEYTIDGSKIIVDGSGIKLYLYLRVPKEQYTLKDDVVVGVNFGTNSSVVYALNSDIYKRDYLEPKSLIMGKQQRTKDAEHSIKKALGKGNPKHGKTSKERSLSRLNISQKRRIKSINEKISSCIVLFARRNNAKHINIEDMGWYGANLKNTLLVREGNYADLEEQLIRRAHKFGMDVRKVNPYNLTQVCSFCGCQEDGQLRSAHRFVCKNPDCVSHGFKKDKDYVDPDFNTARNIALSTDFKSNRKRH